MESGIVGIVWRTLLEHHFLGLIQFHVAFQQIRGQGGDHEVSHSAPILPLVPSRLIDVDSWLFVDQRRTIRIRLEEHDRLRTECSTLESELCIIIIVPQTGYAKYQIILLGGVDNVTPLIRACRSQNSGECWIKSSALGIKEAADVTMTRFEFKECL
ncbi:unnamed protein product [Notodromas monacha]|uniref:Uncharacterized protein n=1 Tax=Notodromas monacha TaxID=399045 RepID=A0A7R9BHK1_9CRUS|nr:unnamed protein product [Notodromas monacha]CAG0914800.1 unnamed protein product [Notodromas monacha]